MNTQRGRLTIIGRDVSSAAGALTNLHRCLVKIEERVGTLRAKGIMNLELNIAAMRTEEYISCAKRMLGACLGELDKATATIDTERRRDLAERRAAREAVRKEMGK